MRFMYLYREGTKACEHEPLQVSLNGLIVGAIHKVEGGYRMIPNRKDMAQGEVMANVAAVQASLPVLFANKSL